MEEQELKKDPIAEAVQQDLDAAAQAKQEKLPKTDQKVIDALRMFADQLEKEEITPVDFIVMMPKIRDGNMPILYLGEPIPQMTLYGMLMRSMIRMGVM